MCSCAKEERDVGKTLSSKRYVFLFRSQLPSDIKHVVPVSWKKISRGTETASAKAACVCATVFFWRSNEIGDDNGFSV